MSVLSLTAGDRLWRLSAVGQTANPNPTPSSWQRVSKTVRTGNPAHPPPKARTRHALALLGWFSGMVALQLPAQPQTNQLPILSTNTQPTAVEEPASRPWSLSASAYAYFVPESQNYVQPTLGLDYHRFHAEARYNYENLKTGSTWLGYNFGLGKKLTFAATPMLGGVFGNTTGIAPGYRFSLAYGKLELASEGEYVFDTRDSAGNFFYTWSELAVAPLSWLRLGLAIQRTKAYQTDLDIQRGFLVGVTYNRVGLTVYVLNPDHHQPSVVLAGNITF